MLRRDIACRLMGVALATTVLSAQSAPPPTQTPIPKPFPNSSQGSKPATKPATTPAAPPGSAQDAGAVDPRLVGVPLYAGAEFLESLDVGRGQRLFIFGTNDPYATVVGFYKGQFRKSGEEVSRQPAIQQFDLGPFNSGSMDHRPSLMVKDFVWPEAAGYIHVDGTTEKRFKTLIQIVR